MTAESDVTVSFLTEEGNQLSFHPSCVIAQAQMNDKSAHTAFEVMGLGAHPDASIAAKIAVAELSERYAVTQVPWSSVQLGSLKNHPQRIDPRTIQELSLERAKLFQLTCFNPAQSYHWVNAKEVLTAQPVQLLADLVYVYRPPAYDHRFAWVTSSGVAAHNSELVAEQSALLELFERDALMVTWMTRRQPPHISFNHLPAYTRAAIEKIRREGYRCYSLDLTCRAVPVAMAVAYRKSWPALIVTTAARFSLRKAVVAAWKELEVELFWRLREQQRHPAKPKLTASEIISVADHAAYYSHPDNLHQASFLWQNGKITTRPIDELIWKPGASKVFSLIACSQSLGLDTVYKFKYGDVLEHTVIRLLSPNLVPLFFGYNQFPANHIGIRTARVGVVAKPPWLSASIPPHPLA